MKSILKLIFSLTHNHYFYYYTTTLILQKSYTKKGKARAAAKQRLANGKSNGHITHDINHNETKPEDEKKEK